MNLIEIVYWLYWLKKPAITFQIWKYHMWKYLTKMINIQNGNYPKIYPHITTVTDFHLKQTPPILVSLWICLPGADPRFFLGGGAPVRNGVTDSFFLQNTSCIRKPQVISGRGVHPLHPPPRSAPVVHLRKLHIFLKQHPAVTRRIAKKKKQQTTKNKKKHSNKFIQRINLTPFIIRFMWNK